MAFPSLPCMPQDIPHEIPHGVPQETVRCTPVDVGEGDGLPLQLAEHLLGHVSAVPALLPMPVDEGCHLSTSDLQKQKPEGLHGVSDHGSCVNMILTVPGIDRGP